MSNDMRHMDHIDDVASADCVCLREKERTYRGSWKKRGGVGASMMVLRKVDRLENMLVQRSYDIFRDAGDGSDGSMLAEIRDLRRYLLLVEAEMVARSDIAGSPRVPVGRIQYQDDEKLTAPHNRVIVGRGFVNLEQGAPGTPEDGGHHARQATEHANWDQVGVRRAPRAHSRRLEEGYARQSDMPPGVPNFMVRDPRVDPHHPRFEPPPAYWLITRGALSAEDLDQLPRLAVELNDKEHAETLAEYRGLYTWDGIHLKWKMRDEYRLLWGKQA